LNYVYQTALECSFLCFHCRTTMPMALCF